MKYMYPFHKTYKNELREANGDLYWNIHVHNLLLMVYVTTTSWWHRNRFCVLVNFIKYHTSLWFIYQMFDTQKMLQSTKFHYIKLSHMFTLSLNSNVSVIMASFPHFRNLSFLYFPFLFQLILISFLYIRRD